MTINNVLNNTVNRQRTFQHHFKTCTSHSVTLWLQNLTTCLFRKTFLNQKPQIHIFWFIVSICWLFEFTKLTGKFSHQNRCLLSYVPGLEDKLLFRDCLFPCQSSRYTKFCMFTLYLEVFLDILQAGSASKIVAGSRSLYLSIISYLRSMEII